MDMLQIQKRINAVIESRRKAGEDLPPAPKTAIAGPEFFGFNQPEVRSPCCNLRLALALYNLTATLNHSRPEDAL